MRRCAVCFSVKLFCLLIVKNLPLGARPVSMGWICGLHGGHAAPLTCQLSPGFSGSLPTLKIVYFFLAFKNGIALNIFLAGIIHGAPECVGVVVGLAAAGVLMAE